jgi:hypothetical protein
LSRCADPAAAAARWEQIKALFNEALDLDVDARRRFFDRACAEDATLRAELISLLAAYETTPGFLERPALAGGLRLEADAPRVHAAVRTPSPRWMSPRLGIASLIVAGTAALVWMGMPTSRRHRIPEREDIAGADRRSPAVTPTILRPAPRGAKEPVRSVGALAGSSTPPPTGYGRVSVVSATWAEIQLDYGEVYQTPCVFLRVPAGRHRLRATRPEYGELIRTIDVVADEDRRVRVDLELAAAR